jgi:hypothetical protein
MLLRQLLTASIVAIAIAGCASAPATGSAPKPQADRGVSGYPIVQRWIATLNPTQSYSATAVSSQRQNAYGRVELTVSPDNPTLTDVKLVVSVPARPGMDVVGWGLSQGRCGSGNPPVLPPSTFPPIQLSPNGRGTADAKLPFVISENGTYHVNVFRGTGTQLSDVITCGEVRRES